MTKIYMEVGSQADPLEAFREAERIAKAHNFAHMIVVSENGEVTRIRTAHTPGAARQRRMTIANGPISTKAFRAR